MDFEPKTEIWFLRTGIDANNKVVCENKDELLACLTREGNIQGKTTANSFQRMNGGFAVRVDHSTAPYYALLQADTVLYLNEETTAAFYVVGNITSVEWKNPDTSFVYFVVDAFMTYQLMVDWDKTIAYIEREHVKEDWSNGGSTPLFTNIGMYEDFKVTPDTPLYHKEITYKPNLVLVHSPYGMDAKPSFEGTTNGGLYSSLNSPIFGATAANNFFTKVAEEKEASINNIMGVYGVPSEWGGAIQNGTPRETTEELPVVEDPSTNMTTYEVKYRNAKCWAAPYCIIKLFSSDGSSLTFNPQWFGNEAESYKLRTKIVGSGGQFGGAACTFDNAAGAFDWKNWNDFTVFIRELPKCPWTADGFREWSQIQNGNILARQVNTFIHGIAGTANGVNSIIGASSSENEGGIVGGIGQIATAISSATAQMASIQASINLAQATGATVEGTGSYGPLFDIGQDAWGFKVVYYIVQNYIMRSIDQFFDRFGYRVNVLKKIGLKNRPYWTFVKTVECHVANNTGIPVSFQNQINAMFNSGVTLWNPDKYKTGHKIGDFSVAEDNRGIAGG